MKTIVAFVATACVAIGCGSAPEVTKPLADLPTPCNDSLFQAISHKDINQQTDREYDYFLKKSKECEDFRLSAAQAEQKRQEEQKSPGSSFGMTVLGVGMAVLGTALLVLVPPPEN